MAAISTLQEILDAMQAENIDVDTLRLLLRGGVAPIKIRAKQAQIAALRAKKTADAQAIEQQVSDIEKDIQAIEASVVPQ